MPSLAATRFVRACQVTAVCLAALSAVAVAPASAARPPTLDGESLPGFLPSFPGCHGAGSGSVDFTGAHLNAFGPYTGGTWSTHGTIDYGRTRATDSGRSPRSRRCSP